MRNPSLYFTIVAASVALISAAAAASDTTNVDDAVAGDVTAGEALYKKSCRGCHGPTAKGLASYPKLRDQSVEYLVDRLERYRKGEKFGPNTALMAPNAKNLSDDDILNISTFIASLD
ncbi:MAG: cytochrome c [Pseudomonadota bacterium]